MGKRGPWYFGLRICVAHRPPKADWAFSVSSRRVVGPTGRRQKTEKEFVKFRKGGGRLAPPVSKYGKWASPSDTSRPAASLVAGRDYPRTYREFVMIFPRMGILSESAQYLVVGGANRPPPFRKSCLLQKPLFGSAELPKTALS